MTADRVSFVTNIHKYDDINTAIKKQPSISSAIVICDGPWIGMNATILDGSYVEKIVLSLQIALLKGHI